MKVLSLVIALAFVPAVGSASAFSKKAHLDVKKVIQAKFKKSSGVKAQEVTDCTNFSGKWSGTCVDGDNNSTPISLNITQTACTGFTAGLPDLIEKVEAGNSVDSKEVSGLWATMDWDKDGKNLFLVYTVAGRANGSSSSYGASIIRGLSLSGTKLTIEEQGVVFGLQDGQAGAGEIKETCTLTKTL